jgi:hypothetical protein
MEAPTVRGDFVGCKLSQSETAHAGIRRMSVAKITKAGNIRSGMVMDNWLLCFSLGSLGGMTFEEHLSCLKRDADRVSTLQHVERRYPQRSHT